MTPLQKTRTFLQHIVKQQRQLLHYFVSCLRFWNLFFFNLTCSRHLKGYFSNFSYFKWVKKISNYRYRLIWNTYIVIHFSALFFLWDHTESQYKWLKQCEKLMTRVSDSHIFLFLLRGIYDLNKTWWVILNPPKSSQSSAVIDPNTRLLSHLLKSWNIFYFLNKKSSMFI